MEIEFFFNESMKDKEYIKEYIDKNICFCNIVEKNSEVPQDEKKYRVLFLMYDR